MKLNEVDSILKRLAQIHIQFSSQVDFGLDDRRKAIWYLQGCAISAATATTSLYALGLAVAAAHEWRFVNEVRELVQLFDEMSDDDRRIKAWYKGRVIERRRAEHQTDLHHPMLTDEFYARLHGATRDLINELSTFAHPTIGAARYNVHRTQYGELFDYKWGTIREFPDLLLIVKAATICAVHSLQVPIRTLSLSRDVQDELTSIYERVEQIISETIAGN